MSIPTNIIYSEPGSQHFFRFEQQDGGSDRFVIRPFCKNKSVLRGATASCDPLTWKPTLSSAHSISVKGREAYLRFIEQAIAWCEEYQGKVVCSRSTDVSIGQLEPGTILQSLRQKHPQAFIYGLEHPEFGCWLGATPEMLLRAKEQEFETVALAGTKHLDERWTAKEQKEQQVVTDYILECLSGMSVKTSGPADVHFGALKHLRTHLQWTSDETAEEIAERLHPTPAVGGMPSTAALDFILEHEGYDRGLYTGYLGPLNQDRNSQLYVNLRCFQLYQGCARFYAGGGINQWSSPEAEWEETERKIDSTRSVIASL